MPDPEQPVTQSCWFAASDPNASLVGVILPIDEPGTDNAVAKVFVTGATSTPFVLPPGKYRYEFNIASNTKFTLKLYVHGVDTPCQPNSFDPNDPSLGHAAAVDRKARFQVI